MFLVKAKNAFVPVELVYSMNTYEFQLSHEGVSGVSRLSGASERAERAIVTHGNRPLLYMLRHHNSSFDHVLSASLAIKSVTNHLPNAQNIFT